MTDFNDNALSAIRAAVANLDDGFALFDSRDHLVAWNAAYESLNTEIRDLLVAGLPFEDLIRAVAERGQVTDAVGREEDWIAERRQAHRNRADTVRQVSDGRWFLVRECDVPATGGSMGLWIDITEQRAADAALRASEKQLQTVLENVDQGVALFDENLDSVLANSRFHELLDIPADVFPPGSSLETLVRHNAGRGEYGEVDVDEQVRARTELARALEAHHVERTRPDGTVIDIRSNPLPGGGFVNTYSDITERKRAEESVRQSRAHLLDAFESISAGLALYDADDRLILHNHHFAEIFPVLKDILEPGVRFADLLLCMGEALHAAGRIESADGFIEQRLREFRDCAAGLEHQTPDGRWIRYSEFRTRQGGTLSVREDVTSQKHADIALRESEARFRDFAEVSAELLWEMDADLRFTFVSPIVERFGAPASAVLGKRRQDLRPAGVQRSEEDEEMRALRERVPYRNVERRSDLRDDIWVSVSGKPLFADDGIFLGFRGATRNITERKRAEQRLADNRNVLASILNALPLELTLVEPDGTLAFVNDLMARQWGFDREKAIGTPVYQYFPADIAARARENNRHIVETGESIPFFESVVDRRGRSETVLIGKIPLKSRSGKVTGICTMAMDITSRVEAERAYRETRERLQQAQKMETVGQLTGGVAHDFNNLMGIIVGNVELLADRIRGDPEARRQIDAVKRAVERGAALTGRLLAFSRRQALSPESVDAAELVGGLADLLQRTLGETVDLTVDTAADLGRAVIDPHQFENALVNLAVNARDALPDGGALVIEAANVSLDETYAAQSDDLAPGDYVRVSVSDNGTGIPPESLDRVFEPFYTTKEVGKGSGLGLSMVYGFAKQSNGHVTIYSEVGQGTTVNLYLPRADSSEAATGQQAAQPAARDLRGTERILVVEDDATLREIPVAVLRRHGYDIVEAADGAQAMAALEAVGDFDLLFTDVVLPGGMSGVDIAAAAERLRPGIKVLYTSGYTENAVVHNGRLDPGVNLLTKPYASEKLLEMVRAVLDGE